MGIVTLTTDFGVESPYVAAMKGVLLSINPAVSLVDVSHAIGPQDVRHGAVVLADTWRFFPPGTVHVAVIDPGVGTDRAILAAEVGGHVFVLPDNGLLSLVAAETRPRVIVRLAETRYWRDAVSHTFHGRDMMAPVAAHLSRGVPIATLGPPIETIVRLDWPVPRVTEGSIEGEVLTIDAFGNLTTNISEAMLHEVRGRRRLVAFQCGTLQTPELVSTYGERPSGTCIALIGSSGRLEMAVVGGSAAREASAAVGDRVAVRFS